MIICSLITVLIVEDSLSELELMSHYLDNGDYKIVKSTGAKEAFDIALKDSIDVVISDVVMPEMSGFELCRQLKRNPVTEKLPIILCTSKNQEIDKLWGIKQGASAYLTKPYTREQLIETIQSVFV
ncbi:response regulator receiver, CheY [Calothrix parasitica NIES-267]|uniref:Response regulator receiver, CheY n=1 Tax=Calothrix parasitica NIES-267 TaxID=1973488 RepID=A0A1Z4LLQ7_9CYAN|nr:response regulator receiver, CheY [Calothrix parasitica NIES-267]